MIQGIDKYFEPFVIERMSISYDDFGSPTEAYTVLKTASLTELEQKASTVEEYQQKSAAAKVLRRWKRRKKIS